MIRMSKELCDKCGIEVTIKNDSVTMSAIAWDEPFAGLFSMRRCIDCSPSRAQHIVHPDFPPVEDDRPQFDKRNPEVFPTEEKRKEYQLRWTSAWLMCQNEEVAKAYLARISLTHKPEGMRG